MTKNPIRLAFAQGRRHRLARLIPGLAAGTLLLALPGGLTAKPAAGRPVERLEIGLARSCFPDVNLNDVVAAYRVILQNLGRRQGYEITPDVTIYDDTPQFEAAVKRGALHLAVMDAWQYLDLERLPGIRPAFVPAIDGRVGRRFVVLARRGSGLHTVADLRGRAVVILKSVNNNVCRHWLETLLPDDPAQAGTDFLAKLESAAKPTAVVLPVFFGRKAACVVDEATFNLMVELNPQVGTVLEVIAASEVFADVVVCLGDRKWVSPEARADAMNILTNLDADPAGRQVLTLFKISGQVPFQDGQLRTVRALRRTVQQRRPASPAGGHLP